MKDFLFYVYADFWRWLGLFIYLVLALTLVKVIFEFIIDVIRASKKNDDWDDFTKEEMLND